MTGAILGGSSVQQAARLQMIIMFMITASTTLASVFTTFAAITVTVDQQHRVRGERIEKNGGGMFGALKGGIGKVGDGLVTTKDKTRSGWSSVMGSVRRRVWGASEEEGSKTADERTRLLV